MNWKLDLMRCIALIFLLSLATKVSGDELFLSLSVTGKLNGKSFEFKITRDQVKDTPIWPAQAEHPPLSPRRAQEIARKFLRTFAHDADKWPLHQIDLIDMGDHQHWIYEVEFMRSYPDDVAVTGGDYFDIPVFMDGKVMAPDVTLINP